MLFRSGALLALDSVFSVGMLIAYLSYKDQFATRAGALIDKGIEFRMLRLHAQRLADIMLAEPEDGPLHEEVALCDKVPQKGCPQARVFRAFQRRFP